MSTSDNIIAWFKSLGGNPSVDDIKSRLGGDSAALRAPDDAQATPESNDRLSVSPDAMLPKSPTIPGSSFDVATSDTTAPMDGSAASVGADAPFKPDMPSHGVSGSWDAPTPIESNPPSSGAPSTVVPVKPPLVAPPASPPAMDHTEDQRRREANDAAIEHKRRMGLFGAGIAGIGDAIASGNKAYGVNNATDTASKVLESGDKSRKADKLNIELKIKRDPNSDVSQAYRKMVSQIVPDLAKAPEFLKMSAQDIGDKLPMIDTIMRAQAAKDAKEMGMAQLKANKDISIGVQANQHQDKLEQNYKQQFISVRGDQNISGLEKQRDAAAQAYNLIRDSQGKEGKHYNLSEPQLVELYGQMMMAMTGRGLTGESLAKMDQASAKSKTAALATFIGLSPSATTDAIGDRLKHMTTTLGPQVQSNLDKRMEGRLLPPSGLDPKRAAPIREAGRSRTFQEQVALSDERAMGTSSGPAGSRKTKSGVTYSVE